MREFPGRPVVYFHDSIVGPQTAQGGERSDQGSLDYGDVGAPELRVVRGGSCCSYFALPTTTNRLAFPAGYRDRDIGFRCARSSAGRSRSPGGGRRRDSD